MRAEQSIELNEKIGEIIQLIGELRVDSANREVRIIKWVFGAIFAGVVLNTGITSLLLVTLPKFLN